MRITNTVLVSTDDLVNFGYDRGLTSKTEWLHAIARRFEEDSPETIFPAWKTINLGTGLKTPDDFRRAHKESGYCVSDRADEILSKLSFTVAN